MTDELRVEAEGETVGEAKWLALRELERAGSLEQQQALAGFPAQVAAWQESKRALALLLTGDAAGAADAKEPACKSRPSERLRVAIRRMA